MNNFLFRLVQFYRHNPPQIYVACKRCLGMFSCQDVFSILTNIQRHDCSEAILSDFTGIPETLKK